MIKKILVPLDGSELAECALPYVEELGEKLGSEVTLISVTNRKQGYWIYQDPSTRPTQISMPGNRGGQSIMPVGVCSMEEQAAKYLDTAANKLGGKSIKINKEVVCGKTAEEIVIYAHVNEIDLIVMSSHGRSGPSKLVRGNIAQKVLNRVRIPVMMVLAPGCGPVQ